MGITAQPTSGLMSTCLLTEVNDDPASVGVTYGQHVESLPDVRYSFIRKDIIPHGFHKLTVAFSGVSTLQYGYFDVGMLF